VSREATGSVARDLLSLLATYHAEHPLEPGASLQFVRSQTGAREDVFDDVLRQLVRERKVAATDGLVRLAEWVPTVGERERETIERLFEQLTAAGAEPPDVPDLAQSFGSGVEGMLRFLERSGRVVQVEQARYYAADGVKQLLAKLERAMVPGREYPPAELREVLGVSRKYLIPFLEYCDRIGFTYRHQTGRMRRTT